MRDRLDELDQMKRENHRLQAQNLQLRRATLEQAAQILARDEQAFSARGVVLQTELAAKYGLVQGDGIDAEGAIVRAPKSVPAPPVATPAEAAPSGAGDLVEVNEVAA